MEPATEERLLKIENHLAQLEHLVDQLNEAVLEKENQLRQLRKHHHQLNQRLQTFEMEQIQKQNERPPHYE